MNWITDILAIPIGIVMRIFYGWIPNYAVALLLITIVTRLFMIPSTIKQQKSGAKMAALQPKIREIQDRYKNNREKMNEEIQKVYASEGYNPMSGCLPMLITWPIFFGLIGVIYRPLTYLLNLDPALVNEACAAVEGVTLNPNAGRMLELYVVQYQDLSFIKDIFPNGTGLDLTFFGLDLSKTPDINNFSALWIIPILAGVTQFFTFLGTMKSSGQSGGLMMGILFPLITVMMSFSFPGAVGLYWVYSALVAAIQSFILRKYYNPNAIIVRNLFSAEKRRRQKFSA